MNTKKLWNKFDELSGRCYNNMIGTGEPFEVWDETFDILMDIISVGRDEDPNYAKELIDLEDSTDFEYDISGWLEDYLDELDMYEKYEKLEKVCDKLLKIFSWVEESPSELRFRKALVLKSQGKNQEALKFCEKWYHAEEDNILAATSLIYARLGVKDIDGAECLVKKYISEDTVCSEENDIVFIAAETLYKVSKNKKAEKQISQALKKYEEQVEAYMLGEDYEDEDFWDEELPFN